MRGHNSKKTTWTYMQIHHGASNMDKLDEMMFWRDDMERYWYPLEMLREITESIDMIITEGMHNRK